MIPSFFRQIGSDRHLASAEVAETPASPRVQAAWNVYATHFQSFTGATLDPQFHRLRHPATQEGSVWLEAGATVLVVGNGPSLAHNIDALKRLRTHVRLFTSPRGAETLLSHDIVPDLVLVEHQTALDAHHSARHLGDRPEAVLARCPLVVAEWQTPPALLAGVSPRSLLVPASPATWGLWPATAAAMAIDAGASCVGLLGIDLGTLDRPDVTHGPLTSLLGLISTLSAIPTVDCGLDGAHKEGWLKLPLSTAAGSQIPGPCQITVSAAPRVTLRFDEARTGIHQLGRTIERARALYRVAAVARAGDSSMSSATLQAAIHELMAWRDDARIRVLLQECLGAAFLPRLWRIGIDMSLGQALWRPLMLATHEILGQAEALSTIAVTERAA